MQGTPRQTRTRVALIAAPLSALALAAGGCGDDEPETTTAADSGTDLTAVKEYLTDHSTALAEQTTEMRELGDRYYELAERSELRLRRAAARPPRRRSSGSWTSPRQAFAAANPAYEEMEGIVAGVPRLAQYDVDIDAGADALRSRERRLLQPRAAERRDAEAARQPLLPHRDRALRHQPGLPRQGRRRDVDGDGKVEFGEGLPDAEIYVGAAARVRGAGENLDADAQEFEPTPSDAFTAITVMTPTMSEYFEAWKNSRFIAGEKATEQGFVATSRLRTSPTSSSGIVFTYDEIEPEIAAEDPQQAEQTKQRARASCWPTSRTCATRRPRARSSPPRRPTRSAPRPSAAPRRSPAR